MSFSSIKKFEAKFINEGRDKILYSFEHFSSQGEGELAFARQEEHFSGWGAWAKMDVFVSNKDESSLVVVIVGPVWKRDPMMRNERLVGEFNYGKGDSLTARRCGGRRGRAKGTTHFYHEIKAKENHRPRINKASCHGWHKGEMTGNSLDKKKKKNKKKGAETLKKKRKLIPVASSTTKKANVCFELLSFVFSFECKWYE